MRTSMCYGAGPALFVALAVAACGEGRPPTTPTSGGSFVGRYSLTVTAGPACTTLPEVVRNRPYTATIELRGLDNYVITLSDGRFLRDEYPAERTIIPHCSAYYGLDCNQFTASREGDQLRFRLASNYDRFNDEFAGSGGMIVELIGPQNDQLGISGMGLGRLDGTTIRASIDGGVWYCPAKYSSADEECVTCRNATVAMTFTR